MKKKVQTDGVDELNSLAVFGRLQKTINSRKKSPAEKSYIASLLQAKADKVLKKVAEETAEFILASSEFGHNKTPDNRQHLIAEAADVLFHLQIALAYYDVEIFALAEELIKREGVSGLLEKANRKDVANKKISQTQINNY